MIARDRVDKILARLPVIEAELSDPAVATDPRRLRTLVQEHSHLKKIGEKADRVFNLREQLEGNRELAQSEDADPELKEMALAELSELEADLAAVEKDLMFALLPPDPNAKRSAIVEVRAGTGGDEAGLFAGDLFRMYSRFAEQQGWKVGVIDASPTEMGGYKEVVFSVEGEGAYGTLQYESGGHRVQRIPVTESSGRIHTSAATVAVFPEAEVQDKIEIPPDEIRVDIFRSSGPGGQSVNTTDSAVRMTHLPTGIVVQCQDEKSQHRNKEKALSVLKARLLDHRQREEAEKMGDTRRSMIGSGDRSERVRTYNFPQNRLSDHRVNLTLYSLDRIVEGELGELTTALREHDMELRLSEELSHLAGSDEAEG